MDKHDVHKNHDHKEKHADNKKDKSLQYVLIGIAIIIVVIGVAILSSKYLFKNTNELEYNHYVFQKFEGTKWTTQLLVRGQLYNIPFYYNPMEVTDIAADPASVTAIRAFRTNPNGTLYVTVDPEESSRVVIASVEYVRILGTVYNIYNMNVKSAISKPTNATAEYPIVTCKDQSKDTFVVYQVVTGKNVISTKGNCVILESINATESIRVADAFAFGLLNIIQENSTLTK